MHSNLMEVDNSENSKETRATERSSPTVDVYFCIPTDEEIEKLYKDNLLLSKQNKINLVKKVVDNIPNDYHDPFQRHACPLTDSFNEIENTPKEVEDQIKYLILKNYEEHKIKVEYLRENYKELYYEWLENRKLNKKPNINLEDPDFTPSSNQQPLQREISDYQHLLNDESITRSNRRRGSVTSSVNLIKTLKPSEEGDSKNLQNVVFRRRIVSDAVKTEAEFQAVLELLSGNNNNTNSNVSLDNENVYAVEPDLELSPLKIDMLMFVNHNDQVHDFKADFCKHNQKVFSSWSDEEREVFFKNFLIYGKDFYKIASYLPNKSVSACVHYYYREKNRLGLSHIARKSLKQRKRILRNRYL